MSLSKKVACDFMVELEKMVRKWEVDYLKEMAEDNEKIQKQMGEQGDEKVNEIVEAWFHDFVACIMGNVAHGIKSAVDSSEKCLDELEKNNNVNVKGTTH